MPVDGGPRIVILNPRDGDVLSGEIEILVWASDRDGVEAVEIRLDDQRISRMEDPETVLVPSEIWCETISLIQHRQGFEAAVAAGGDLMALPHVELLPSRMDVIRAAWDRYRGAGGGLSFADCMVLEWCMNRRASPLSFDERILGHFRSGRS